MQTFEALFSIMMVICGVIIGFSQGRQKIINNTQNYKIKSCSDFFIGIK